MDFHKRTFFGSFLCVMFAVFGCFSFCIRVFALLFCINFCRIHLMAMIYSSNRISDNLGTL